MAATAVTAAVSQMTPVAALANSIGTPQDPFEKNKVYEQLKSRVARRSGCGHHTARKNRGWVQTDRCERVFSKIP
jgi:hypothetical protein